MRLLLVADIHDAVDKVEALDGGYDAVIAAGDYTYKRRLDAAVEVLKSLRRIAPVYFVPGNTDPPELARYSDRDIHPLHGRVVELGEYRVGGVGGSLPTPFDDLFRLGEEEIESLLNQLTPTPQILVVHNPPRGHLDKVGRVKPVGSVAVRRYIETKQPKLSIHGHIHEDWGIDLLGETVLVNPGPLRQGRYAEATLGSKIEVVLKSL